MLRDYLTKLDHRWSKIPISYRGGIILTIPAMCMIAILVVWSEGVRSKIVGHAKQAIAKMRTKKVKSVLSQ